jgi:CDGSH-type Zn-finger protein/uncharacterized Fe-S cluster protein YjdI
VDVFYDDDLCMSAGECNRAEGGLFVKGRDPWCVPDGMGVEQVVEIIKRCPTGALTCVRKDGGPAEAPAPWNNLLVSNNGPYYLAGDLVISGARPDQAGLRCRAALCRCGRSQNKPFCDDRHEDPLFDEGGAVGEKGPGFTGGGGPLKVERNQNGPLTITGKLTVHSGSGREAWKGEEADFCRCGNSANKPFCDGAHRKMGFRAD